MVSIPSRRVGDSGSQKHSGCAGEVSIPSRRVGDRKPQGPAPVSRTSFPSPQGGSETRLRWWGGGLRLQVSIPSRRVGDRVLFITLTFRDLGFHPLKAGRRRTNHTISQPAPARFHPLKAGRRLRKSGHRGWENQGFHPLKAGRRPTSYTPCLPFVGVSIPSRRVGDPT